MNLVTLAMFAPWIAVSVDPDVASPNVLHAITMEAAVAGWSTDDPMTFISACGTPGLRIVGSDGVGVQWPPRVSSLVAPMVRCRECHELTGKKRPVSSFVKAGAA